MEFAYTIFWFGLVIIAIVNGAIRELWYRKSLSELAAHQLSTLTAIALFSLYIWLLNLRWTLESSRQAITIGVIWLGLTIAFEFLFGHFVSGHSWERLLADYNLLKGRIWLLVLLWTAIAPYVVYKLQV